MELQNVRTALGRSEAGEFDITSVTVGAIVVGILAAGVLGSGVRRRPLVPGHGGAGGPYRSREAQYLAGHRQQRDFDNGSTSTPPRFPKRSDLQSGGFINQAGGMNFGLDAGGS